MFVLNQWRKTRQKRHLKVKISWWLACIYLFCTPPALPTDSTKKSSSFNWEASHKLVDFQGFIWALDRRCFGLIKQAQCGVHGADGPNPLVHQAESSMLYLIHCFWNYGQVSTSHWECFWESAIKCIFVMIIEGNLDTIREAVMGFMCQFYRMVMG